MNNYCALKVKPYNRYNLFFILERELILQKNNPTYDPLETFRAPDFLTGFEGIEMPSELPKRYSKLVLPPGWYLPGRNKRRSHTKSHGLMAFTDLSRGVAQNYRTIDKETFNFLDAVAKSLMKRSREIKARGGLKSLPGKMLVPSSPNVNMAHVQASSTCSSAPVSPTTVIMNRLEQTKSITQRPVETFRWDSNIKRCSETQNDTLMMEKSGPMGTVQKDPNIIETTMLPADRPRTFIMTCVPCREDYETNVGSPSSASSVWSGSSSSSTLPLPVSLEDLSTSADIWLLTEDTNTLPGRLEPFVEAGSMKFVVAVCALQVGHLVRLDA
ncbi:hypothetical protein THAOC_03689 [Thalassiosira oceanica]|uniref:Uncharacterized protein n=1 Tax=Thalassiosira oceanica TaxID=159749 RepID=K0TKK0_THAOC|nr:hypothetical protein THAOC_03689 [Thalassiosira oceanica]|eukprot:EJK74621.1 hypothetical protein THAOC_03689 [Thalassiosira oceanica]